MSKADVCLILEGTYPYVTGGVSSWTHDLLLAHQDLRFQLVTLLPKNANPISRYQVPRNVIGQSQIFVQGMPAGSPSIRNAAAFFGELEKVLLQLQARGGLRDVEEVLRVIAPVRASLGHKLLMNSQPAWQMLLNMYKATVPASSFLDFFWSWRSLIGGLFSVLLADLPEASLYHAVSTGYAGLFLARAHAETGRPGVITEHGIYTNERRIEMAMANWLHDTADSALQIERAQKTLKDLWVDTFIAYSHASYEACEEIITLYAGNQQFQLQDGAPPGKLRVIPNGIDYDRYAAIQRDKRPRRPTIALIGRVVPIKDVKTFIRACSILRDILRELEALILGPTDEDENYFRECQNMVGHLNLESTVTFAGRVNLDEYLGKIDVIVLTSISEAQPLVVLEAGAVGIPAVTTDVGSCRELLFGSPGENPPLGPGGDVSPLCNPSATAHSLARLLTDPEWYDRCSQAIKERVRLYYNKKLVDRTYRELYGKYLNVKTPLLENTVR